MVAYKGSFVIQKSDMSFVWNRIRTGKSNISQPLPSTICALLSFLDLEPPHKSAMNVSTYMPIVSTVLTPKPTSFTAF